MKILTVQQPWAHLIALPDDHPDSKRIENRRWDTAYLMDRIPELQGKTLGCWCGSWEPGQPDIGCHGVVLARLANAIVSEAQQ